MKGSNTHTPKSLWQNSNYNGLPVQTHKGPLNKDYLDTIKLVFDNAMNEYSKVFIFRFDLRYPKELKNLPSSIAISAFFESLRARIKYEEVSAAKIGMRRHRTKVRYVWVKEKATAMGCHYHVVLVLNGHRYNVLGKLSSNCNNLAKRVIKSWASALKVDTKTGANGVYFPYYACYRVNSSQGYAQESILKAFHRTSYLAKLETKEYGQGTRNIGYSFG